MGSLDFRKISRIAESSGSPTRATVLFVFISIPAHCIECLWSSHQNDNSASAEGEPSAKTQNLLVGSARAAKDSAPHRLWRPSTAKAWPDATDS
jgi:hypothetical protein